MCIDFNVVDTDTRTEWIVKSFVAHGQLNNNVIDVTQIMNVVRRLEALAYSWIDSFCYVFRFEKCVCRLPAQGSASTKETGLYVNLG